MTRLPNLLAVAACLFGLIAGFAAAPAQAQGQGGGTEEEAAVSFSAESLTRAIQYMLVWTGDYHSEADGIHGPKTVAAIGAFQAREGLAVTGVLTPQEIELLFTRGQGMIDRYDFEERIDRTTGIVLGVPFNLVENYETTDHGARISSSDGSAVVETMAYGPGEMTLARLDERTRSLGRGRRIDFETVENDTLIMMGTEGDSGFYMMAVEGPKGVRAFSITFPEANRDRFLPVCVAMANTFVPFPELPPGDARAPEDEDKDRGGDTARLFAPGLSLHSTGSGFFVTEGGHVMTNHHVVKDCAELKVADFGTARTLAVDEESDLALLALQFPTGAKPVRFRARPPALGESVHAFGFPLTGLLDAGMNVTSGVVSSLAGLRGNKTVIQITAPVQEGNSGGPLIDARGNLIGVVVGKINALALLKLTGDLPENVNFAVRARYAMALMEAEGLDVSEAADDGDERRLEEISTDARDYTVHIGCFVRER